MPPPSTPPASHHGPDRQGRRHPSSRLRFVTKSSIITTLRCSLLFALRVAFETAPFKHLAACLTPTKHARRRCAWQREQCHRERPRSSRRSLLQRPPVKIYRGLARVFITSPSTWPKSCPGSNTTTRASSPCRLHVVRSPESWIANNAALLGHHVCAHRKKGSEFLFESVLGMPKIMVLMRFVLFSPFALLHHTVVADAHCNIADDLLHHARRKHRTPQV